MALKVIGQEAEEREQHDPLDRITRAQSFGAAFLALAEKEDLPAWSTDLVEAMMEQVDALEDELQ